MLLLMFVFVGSGGRLHALTLHFHLMMDRVFLLLQCSLLDARRGEAVQRACGSAATRFSVSQADWM